MRYMKLGYILYDDQLKIVVVSDAEKFVWSLVSLMKTSHHVSLFASSTKNKMSKTNSSIHLQRTEQSFHGGLLLPLLLAVLLQNHEYKRLYFLLYFYLYRGIWRSVNTFNGLLNPQINKICVLVIQSLLIVLTFISFDDLDHHW